MNHQDLTANVWRDADLELGEGARWVDGRLVLVDILSGRLLTDDASDGLRELVRLDVPLGAVAPASADHWIAAAGTGIALLSASGTLEWLDRPAEKGTVSRRMNDGVCDPSGRFWAGCMAWDETPGAGALFRADHDGTVTQVLDGLTIPNGPAFTDDGRLMYLADSARGVVLRFPVDPASGDLGDPTGLLQLDHGSPDGMTVDLDGNLWTAIWGAGEVRQYTPDGSPLAVVRVPAPQPTSPCLGGADGRQLFVTTAAHGLAPDARELSGSVFAITVPTPGRPADSFGPR